MKIDELQRQVKENVVMKTSHDQTIHALQMLYSAVLLRGDKKEAERLRCQIHDTVDLSLDCSARLSYLGTLDITD